MKIDKKMNMYESLQVDRYQVPADEKTYRVEHYFFNHLSQKASTTSRMSPYDQTVTFSDDHGIMCSLTTENKAFQIFPISIHVPKREQAPDISDETLQDILQSGIDLMADKQDWLRYSSITLARSTPSPLYEVVTKINMENTQARKLYIFEKQHAKASKEMRDQKAEEIANTKTELTKQEEKDAKKNAKKIWQQQQQSEVQKPNGFNLS